jgi:hypothetical protein
MFQLEILDPALHHRVEGDLPPPNKEINPSIPTPFIHMRNPSHPISQRLDAYV